MRRERNRGVCSRKERKDGKEEKEIRREKKREKEREKIREKRERERESISESPVSPIPRHVPLPWG